MCLSLKGALQLASWLDLHSSKLSRIGWTTPQPEVPAFTTIPPRHCHERVLVLARKGCRPAPWRKFVTFIRARHTAFVGSIRTHSKSQTKAKLAQLPAEVILETVWLAGIGIEIPGRLHGLWALQGQLEWQARLSAATAANNGS